MEGVLDKAGVMNEGHREEVRAPSGSASDHEVATIAFCSGDDISGPVLRENLPRARKVTVPVLGFHGKEEARWRCHHHILDLQDRTKVGNPEQGIGGPADSWVKWDVHEEQGRPERQ